MKIKNFINDVKRNIHKKYVRIITKLFYNIQTNTYTKKIIPADMYGDCSFADNTPFKIYAHLNPIPIVYQTINEIYKHSDSLNIHGINVDVEKQPIIVTIWTTRPGMVIGKHGESVDALKTKLINIFNEPKLYIDIQEVHADRTHLSTFY